MSRLQPLPNETPGGGGPHATAPFPLRGRTVAVIGALPESLLRFRGELIATLVADGARVIACSAPAGPQTLAALEAIGAEHRAFPVARTGMNPFADLATWRALWRLLRTERPDHVIAYTIKPVVYAGLVTRAHRAMRLHALITGLGTGFASGEPGEPWRQRAVGKIVERLYRASLRRASSVFFQNDDDRRRFVDHRLVCPEVVRMMPGSGVNLDAYPVRPLPPGPPVFLMVARLLRAKGVREYAEAARLLRREHPDWRFVLAGPHDPSPAAIARDEFDDIVAAGHIDYLGMRDDVAELMSACHVFVLPSYYPEGRPRTVLEALSAGRPVVTTTAPGCRESIEPGESGWLVPPRDPAALARAMREAVADPAELARRARSARRLAEARYDVRGVNTLVIQALLEADGSTCPAHATARGACGRTVNP